MFITILFLYKKTNFLKYAVKIYYLKNLYMIIFLFHISIILFINKLMSI